MIMPDRTPGGWEECGVMYWYRFISLWCRSVLMTPLSNEILISQKVTVESLDDTSHWRLWKSFKSAMKLFQADLSCKGSLDRTQIPKTSSIYLLIYSRLFYFL